MRDWSLSHWEPPHLRPELEVVSCECGTGRAPGSWWDRRGGCGPAAAGGLNQVAVRCLKDGIFTGFDFHRLLVCLSKRGVTAAGPDLVPFTLHLNLPRPSVVTLKAVLCRSKGLAVVFISYYSSPVSSAAFSDPPEFQ